MAFSSVRDMVELCKETGQPLYEVILESDLTESGLTRAESEAEMHRLWAVMQPHTFSRVKRLFNDYLTCTRDADITLVTDIYAAREKDPGDIKAAQIVEGMRANGVNAVLTPSFGDTEAYLRAHWQPGDVVVTLGCGDIDLLNEQIARNGDTHK